MHERRKISVMISIVDIIRDQLWSRYWGAYTDLQLQRILFTIPTLTA